MMQEKIVANAVNVKLIASGHPIAFKARIQGTSVGEGGSSIGVVVNTSASVLNDVTIHAQKGRRKTNTKKHSKMKSTIRADTALVFTLLSSSKTGKDTVKR